MTTLEVIKLILDTGKDIVLFSKGDDFCHEVAIYLHKDKVKAIKLVVTAFQSDKDDWDSYALYDSSIFIDPNDAYALSLIDQ